MPRCVLAEGSIETWTYDPIPRESTPCTLGPGMGQATRKVTGLILIQAPANQVVTDQAVTEALAQIL